MIQNIFNKYNTNTLSGLVVVEELIPHVGLPEVAEGYIMEMIKAGTLIQDEKKLILNLPESKSEPEPITESQSFNNDTIKKEWFRLRQLEKQNPSPDKFKTEAENFCNKFGWNYYILNRQLRDSCSSLGYHSEPSERTLFNKEVLQK